MEDLLHDCRTLKELLEVSKHDYLMSRITHAHRVLSI